MFVKERIACFENAFSLSSAGAHIFCGAARISGPHQFSPPLAQRPLFDLYSFRSCASSPEFRCISVFINLFKLLLQIK